MASINVTDDDYGIVARAAQEAQDEGYTIAANNLDNIARRINAALANASLKNVPVPVRAKRLTWKDCPSCLL